MSSAAKYNDRAVEAAITALTKASLVEVHAGERDQLLVTPEGLALVTALRGRIAEFIGPAYGSIASEDLATAARVLTAITAKLSEELGSS